MMQGRRIFENAQLHVVAGGARAGGLGPVDADLPAGGNGIGKHAGLECRVAPRLCNQPRARGRPDRFGPLGELPVILGGEQALLDRQLAYGDLQNLEIGYFVDHRRRWMLVVPPSSSWSCECCMLCTPQLAVDQPPTGSSQRSGNSVCNVSFSNG